MKRGIIDALYWKLHTSYLKNDREIADRMLGMLEDEGKKSSILEEIGPIHYARFELIQANVKNENYGRLYGSGFETPFVDPFITKERSGEEAEFHMKLWQKEGREKMFECLGIGFWASTLHEVDMYPYGRCDFLVREGRTWYVIEVKTEGAGHSVASQIDKYRLAMELDMSLGLHDKVEAIVIATTFSPYVAGELSRLSVKMVTHNGTVESLKVLT